jgi:hypothetical protein
MAELRTYSRPISLQDVQRLKCKRQSNFTWGCKIIFTKIRANIFVFGTRALGEICASRRQEVTRSWGKIRKDEFHNLYPFLDIVQGTKASAMAWWVM